jgi:uncharacterized damage-inducible protein DinB
MDTIDLLKGLYGHMAWADAAMWRAVVAHDAARADQTIRDRFQHLHLVQYAFLSIWHKTALDLAASNGMDLQRLMEWALQYQAQAAEFLAALDTARLGEAVVVPWSKRAAKTFGREPKTPALAETMMQVASHSTHHRAQIGVRLRELGGEPPITDYIAWIWFDRPAPAWPSF